MNDLKNRLIEAAKAADIATMDTAEGYSFLVRFLLSEKRGEIEAARKARRRGRCAYYLSSEFLIGRLTEANLYNMGILDTVKEALTAAGTDLSRLTAVPDAALGNGGLGRLAACFLEAAATHEIPLEGYGLRYKYGLFRQDLSGGFQKETADDWTAFGDPWSIRRDSEALTVEMCGEKLRAVPYDMPVFGYEGTVGNLRLWQAEAAVPFDFEKFDRGEYAEATAAAERAYRLTALLYPSDHTEAGKKLRLAQQLFLTAATVSDVLRRHEKAHGDVKTLPDYAVFQLNDTHPVLAIPTLIDQLQKRGLSFAVAEDIARRCFAYTNHTVMAEALEVWDAAMLSHLSPEVYGVIVKLHLEQVSRGAPAGTEILSDGRVHMARLASHMSFAVNGVAPLHTEILKSRVLAPFYKEAPAKFSNKTNGITQRRFLALSNPGLSAFITERIGDSWVKNLESLSGLARYLSDEESLKDFAKTKRENKVRLSRTVKERLGEELSPDFFFDIQIKRLHEYKRQLMNAFSVVYFYKGILSGALPDFTPTAYIFGAKSAPGYRRAKGIIRYILQVAERVNTDPAVAGRMRVLFVPDYNVTWAEALIPAGDLSEQISMAGTEASGTGNMKFMLNGAPTLGTYDGANLEILAAAGAENNFFFGPTAAAIEEEQAAGAYDPRAIYESDRGLKEAVDTLVDGTFDDGGTGVFRELYDSLLYGADWHRPDHYRVLGDFRSYVTEKLRAAECYKDTVAYARRGLANTAAAGPFSADRTVKEYAKDIWRV